MALDTKQKRGSAISLSQSFRQWLAEPDGTLVDTDRVSLLKLCSAIAPSTAAPVTLITTRIVRLPAADRRFPLSAADRTFLVPEDDS